MDKKILEIISNETKDSIENLSVVTPSVYASVFSEHAKEHNQSLEDELQLSHEIIKRECSQLTRLQETTSKNVNRLNTNTSKAIAAIKLKDEGLLDNILKETEALRNEIEKLKASVYKDELTHVFNRKWIHDTFLKEGEDCFTKNGKLAIFDLNYFKQINDTHGHVIGDKVLIFIANQLKTISKNVARYGGDEFIIIFNTNKSQQELQNIIEKLRKTILTKKFKAHNTTFHVSFSYGIAPFQAGDSLPNIIEKADAQMYNDKESIKKKLDGI